MVTLQALQRRRQLQRPGDAADAPVPELQQVPGRQITSRLVVDLDQVGAQVLDLTIDQHLRHVGVAQVGTEFVIAAGRQHDQPVHLLLGEHANVLALLAWIVVGIAQDHVEPGVEAGVLDAANDLGEVRVRAVRDHHPDRVRAVVLQAAGQRAGHIVQRRDRVQHTLARTGADEARRVNHVRHGGH